MRRYGKCIIERHWRWHKVPGKKKEKKKREEKARKAGNDAACLWTMISIEGGRCCSSILKKRSFATRKLYYTLCCFPHQRFASRLLRPTTGLTAYMWMMTMLKFLTADTAMRLRLFPLLKHTKCSLILCIFISIMNFCRWIRSRFFSQARFWKSSCCDYLGFSESIYESGKINI